MARQVRERFRTDLGLAIPGSPVPLPTAPSTPSAWSTSASRQHDEVRTRKLELGPEQPRDVIQPPGRQEAINWARLILKHL